MTDERPSLSHFQGVSTLSTSHKKTAFVLAESVAMFSRRFGLENIGFLTLTFRQHITEAKEAQRRLNSLLSNVIKPRYRDYVGVFERQKSGRIHYHLLVNVGKDIRTGLDFEAISNGDYRSASPVLREEWTFWRRMAPRYGFGRTELLPVKSTSVAIGRYVGKYIRKNIEARSESKNEALDKGIRLVRFSNGARAGTTRFMFVSEGSFAWRKKVEAFAAIVQETTGRPVRSIDDLTAILGARWAHRNREFILNLPDSF